MLLRLSRFIHLIPVGHDRVLIVDAVSHVRQVVTNDFAAYIRSFATARQVPAPVSGSPLAILIERGILTDKDPDAELAHVSEILSPFHGRDPAALIQQFRREAMTGGHPFWAVTAALGSEDFQHSGRRVDLLMFGDCDVHMECDFLRRVAAERGVDLRVAATFPDDLRLAAEHKHDAILIGAPEARQSIVKEAAPLEAPHAHFIAVAEKMLVELRKISSAPIMMDNLPEPTVQPMGMSDRGSRGHRNRFRAANLALADLADRHPDVHIVDVAAALNASGNERMVDDGYFGFTHFGSPGWLLQRPKKDISAVHDTFPDLAPLAQLVGGDPYGREVIMAQAHCDALTTVLALNQKKCVIVDLDGILWPGVLAETGRPFSWRPEISSPYSYAGLFFGIHEALSALKRRGILLACVSKNDEAVIKQLWKYESHDLHDILLTPKDLVTWRVNWNDKAENIQSIADELGLALESFLFIDDNTVERERVRQRLPEVEVWGEDIFGLRRRLLNDPRLQTPRLVAGSFDRTERTKGQLERQSARAQTLSDVEFLASLNLETKIVAADETSELERIAELFERTTQFNATARKFPIAVLEALLASPDGHIFVAYAKDRFADHGLIGAAVVEKGEIRGFVISCRVLGLGIEHKLLGHIVENVGEGKALKAALISTDRNLPVRNLYRDNGFLLAEDGLWHFANPFKAPAAPGPALGIVGK